MNKKTVSEEKKNKLVVEIVDDHAQTATFISQILWFNGYKALEAYNVDDAIKISKEENPDLIILDVLLESVKAETIIEKFPKQKIILMDLYDINSKHYSKYKNVVGFLKKPIDSEKLLETVEKVLKKN